MSPELKTINRHIDALTDLESSVSRSTACLHATEDCRLQTEAYRARPAINAALEHFRSVRAQLIAHANRNEEHS